MTRVNNVDVQKVQSFESKIKNDPSAAKKTQVIEGEWIVEEGDIQFQSIIKFEGGETVFKVDNPTFMGGGGTLPGPMHYCLYGLASCYTGTFATMASMLGIQIRKLTTRVEADVDFTRVFGLGDNPVMEEEKWLRKTGQSVKW